MELQVRIDTKDVDKMFENHRKQLPYVMQQTINNTLLDAQQVQQERMLQTFNVRRPNFVKNSVKMIQFAKKDTLTGVLGIADVGGKPTADLYSKFEDGGTKVSNSGGKIAIPTQLVTTSKTGVISKAKRPRNLRNSFKIKAGGKEMIMQRKGRRKNAQINVAYILAPSVQIDDRLMFIPTIEQVIEQNIARYFFEAYNKAITTSR